jgi:hypothetical protein
VEDSVKSSGNQIQESGSARNLKHGKKWIGAYGTRLDLRLGCVGYFLEEDTRCWWKLTETEVKKTMFTIETAGRGYECDESLLDLLARILVGTYTEERHRS